jgi:hypothetical protein
MCHRQASRMCGLGYAARYFNDVERGRVLLFPYVRRTHIADRQRAMMKSPPPSRSLARRLGPRPPSIQRTTSWVAHFLSPSLHIYPDRSTRIGDAIA